MKLNKIKKKSFSKKKKLQNSRDYNTWDLEMDVPSHDQKQKVNMQLVHKTLHVCHQKAALLF